ncbi:hypothetical protein CAEBREN_25259 [Caenorhabditis brenneri]|uniref:DUF7809 domain-containing protein n=1 Tax=Caenorhabditis brenneri TaxID=135651 RepID=G0MWZ1_CAEBE|nr:hypothetical protein CAEBREN_25259 [Caenorhabditis brenneri]
MNTLITLPAALESYIPKQLLKNVEFDKCLLQDELKYVQNVLDNSNDNLRMYGSAESLLENLKVYMEFPLSRKMFPREMGSYNYTIPNIYQTLKKEFLYCKQDLLFYLHCCVYDELELYDNAQKLKFIEYMKKHEERLSGCYEFVKYDHDAFQDIQKTFLHAGSLCVFPKNAEVTATSGAPQLISYEAKDFVNVFDNLISKYPCFFLPNSETKDRNATAVVRVFVDGNLKFVMESELFAAINLKNPDQKPLECMDVEGHYRTVDYKHVLKSYRDQIGDIDFICHLIPFGLHAAVPIVTPTGDHCIQAVDAYMDIITETFITGIFQKITQNTSQMIPKFFAILRKYFPSDIKYRYFINLKLLQKLREELEEFWKPIEDKPGKRVRNVGPGGFTVEDLKKELKYLGYNKIFPEIIGDARGAYTIFHSKKPSELKTKDMFVVIQSAITFILIKRNPCLSEFMYRQKVCMHNRTKPCEPCSKAFKEAEAKIEAEMKAESEQASNSVTAITSGNDAEKEEVSEESKHELVTSEALPIVERDPENLKSTVESSFVEAETKSIPAVLELEVSEHNPVLSNSNNQKMPRESCSKATKESEFELAPLTVTFTTVGNFFKKEESVTSETPSVAINNPVGAETNPLPAISEPVVSEHNPVLPESNDQKISMHHRLEPRESCLKATKGAEFKQASSSVTATTSGGEVKKEEDSEDSNPASVTSEAPSVAINNPVEAETNPPLPAISESKVPEHYTVLPDYNTHVCEKCMETTNEAREEVKETYRKMISQAKKHNEQLELTQKAREEVVETYRKMVVLEKTLKEKDTELKMLRVYEEKSKKSDETEKKSKDLEKEAEGWKMKYFKILEENEKMKNMLKGSENSKALESQVKEKNEQLKKAQKAFEEKKQRCKELEETIEEKDEVVRNLTLSEKWEKENKEDYKATCASEWLKNHRSCAHCRREQLDPTEFPSLR